MKNRIHQLLAQKNINKCPYIPCMDNYVQSGLPESYQNQHIVDMQVNLGSDMIRGINASFERFDDTIQYQKTVKENDVIEEYITPLGGLRQINRFVPESPFIPFPTEHLIKNTEDMAVFRYLTEHTEVYADYKDLDHYLKKYPNKLISASLSDSPFYDMLTKLMGVEPFTMALIENPAEAEKTMDTLHEKKKKHVALSAKSNADVLVIYENTNTSNTMPDWIDKYAFKYLNKYADIAHKYDKPLLIHMCGKINLMLDSIAACKFDGIIDVAPAPTGDCDFARAIDIMEKSGKIISGGIECNQYILENNNEFTGNLRKFIKNVPKSTYYFLGSGDAVPQGATVENLKSAYEVSKIM